jgi:hypothetical protein
MNCLDIICRAMRRIGVIAAGELPRSVEQSDALDTLKALYSRLINDGAFGVIEERHVDAAEVEAKPGERIVIYGGEVSFPDIAPDCSVICVVDPSTNDVEELIFDTRTQTWRKLGELTLTSEAPISHRDPIGLVCALAIELADEYGQELSEITVRNAARWHMALTHNWSVKPETQPGVYF